MKKFVVLFALVASLTSNVGFAQSAGRGSQAGSSGSTEMAWGVGLVGLGVVATVVGLTAASAASSPSTFSH